MWRCIHKLVLRPVPRVACYSDSAANVLVETRDRVRLIAINRPASRNAVNKETADDLYQAFRAFDEDPSVDVAVLHGIGGNFCAGYDLKELASTGGQVELPRSIGEGPSPMVRTQTSQLSLFHSETQGFWLILKVSLSYPQISL